MAGQDTLTQSDSADLEQEQHATTKLGKAIALNKAENGEWPIFQKAIKGQRASSNIIKTGDFPFIFIKEAR